MFDPFPILAAPVDVGPVLPVWVVTAAYLWLAMFCARAWREGRGSRSRFDAWAWPGSAAIFVALGVARPFGLQWRLAAFFRRRARDGGWYDERHGFQTWIIALAMALAVAVVISTAAIVVRKRSSRALAAFAPVAALLGFLAVRAVSLHGVDRLLYRRVAGIEVNAALELTLLGVVAAGLAWRSSRARDRAPAIVARDDETGARRYSIR